MQAKESFVDKLETLHDFNAGDLSILDLGSGQSRNIIPFLERHPHTRYVGVEPSTKDATIARELLKQFPDARVYNQLAYDRLPEEEGVFDICLSLSVLEHVKQLGRFIENSVRMTKRGGHIIHRYDLGHALSPSSIKERLQVFLGDHFPAVLPERKFVRYVDPDEVCALLTACGALVTQITYHQMPNHKKFLRYFETDTDEKKRLAAQIIEWEFSVSPHLDGMDKDIREQLFPAICVWAVKE